MWYQGDNLEIVMSNLNLPNKEESQPVTVFFGHHQWNLAMTMMIGIRTSLQHVVNNDVLSESHFTQVGTYHML
jgi:hypothetical protein